MLFEFDFGFDFAPAAANDRMLQIFDRLVAHGAYTWLKHHAGSPSLSFVRTPRSMRLPP
ncbi:hypothetical protein [Paenibacillus cellulositrophicus]|uniref:hypothetical protein n=1 Tax=Paenibacillus cellulositrophicus TaxID=562959 RepID=UPI00142ED36B|nr:hypothetical protein [Paenibacillus cellulositrophicus]